MSHRSPSPAPDGVASPAAPEQFLVMHCHKEDSLLGREGFSVRAASTTDPALLDWAQKLDPYELPHDMKSGTLLPNQTPRRLARVPAPGGRAALIHSSYLPQDSLGRSNSFISHMLIYDERELGVLEAAAAWGAMEWQTDEYPPGQTKSLPPPEGLPR